MSDGLKSYISPIGILWHAAKRKRLFKKKPLCSFVTRVNQPYLPPPVLQHTNGTIRNPKLPCHVFVSRQGEVMSRWNGAMNPGFPNVGMWGFVYPEKQTWKPTFAEWGGKPRTNKAKKAKSLFCWSGQVRNIYRSGTFFIFFWNYYILIYSFEKKENILLSR